MDLFGVLVAKLILELDNLWKKLKYIDCVFILGNIGGSLSISKRCVSSPSPMCFLSTLIQ